MTPIKTVSRYDQNKHSYDVSLKLAKRFRRNCHLMISIYIYMVLALVAEPF